MSFTAFAQDVEISGELKQWHKVTLTFDGPEASEHGLTNPFTDYRLNVTFANGEQSFTVPGYFAADGDAANTGASDGNKWRVHFPPFSTGEWTYVASFRKGPDVVFDDAPNAGKPCSFDGATGSFAVGPSDKSGNDFRAKGMLQYVGERYMKFAGSGEYFLKGGADSPETFLGYAEFDGTWDMGGIPLPSLEGGLRHYKEHIKDWNEGDPTWKDGKGKGIIGSLNYIGTKNVNSAYFLTMNVQGDGQDVWPYIDPWRHFRFDVSKLDQWEIVFEHMDKLGIMLHVVTQEVENCRLLDYDTVLSNARKVYYRELIARFGHHLAVTWNLGEENTNTDEQRMAFAKYFDSHDPYDHLIVVHNNVYHEDLIYRPLLGFEHFYGASLQEHDPTRSHDVTKKWIDHSGAKGRQWVVTIDEIGPANRGVLIDEEDYWHDLERKDVLWANLMAGGAGVEWYFGWKNEGNTSDLANEDWRNREHMWELTDIALQFFNSYLPFTEMYHADELVAKEENYCFAKAGEVYAVYLKHGGEEMIDLSGANGEFTVHWYDPRNGGDLMEGSVTALSGGGEVELGSAPSEPGKDWTVLVRKIK